MRIQLYFLAFVLSLVPITASCQQQNDPCLYFYEKLKQVPHEELNHSTGKHKSLINLEEQEGCEVKFVTNDSLRTEKDKLPGFIQSIEGTELHQKGWRVNENYRTDGPGSGMYGIEKDDTLCLISYSRPTYLKEPGNIVSSSQVTIIVQCTSKKGIDK